MSKTLFISIYDGDTEKVILRSGVFGRLKAAGHKIVLLIRGSERMGYYQESFGDEQVAVELLPHATTMAEDLWYHVSWNTVPTHAAYLRRRIRLYRKGNLLRFIVETCIWMLGHLRAWREFLRFVYAATPDSYASDLFAKYKPDLLFAPNMFSPVDFRLLRAAKRHGVKTVTTAKSWDVLTTKAFTRVRADRILVYNEFNRQEAIALGDYNASAITVTGFPQFDLYARRDWLKPRQAFCERMGLDPARRIILFAVPGDWKTPFTKDILHALDERISKNEFEKPIQILARLHPKYPDSSEGETFTHVVLNRPGTIIAGKKEFSIDMGIANTFGFTFTDTDIAHLANSLYHSDVVINTESTLTLDASSLDKPVILIGYDGAQKTAYWDSVARIYEREHYRHVTETGAAPLVKSDEELTVAINHFLADSEYLRKEREVLKHNLLFKTDGLAATRTADGILEYVQHG